MQKIIGYHGTKERFASSIIDEGFIIKTKKESDNHWLGHGIYFYSDYELAAWWAKTKVTRQNQKYGNHDMPTVIKASIVAENVWDLDNPFTLKQFSKCQKELEKEFVAAGVRLDFTKGGGHPDAKIRCYWMDAIKEAHNIEVILYTFTRKNPSYIESDYHINTADDYSLGKMGLMYHEKQICVTKDCFIVDKCIVNSQIEKFEEEII